MNSGLSGGLTWLAIIGNALVAGVFFIFSVTIMQSLNKLSAPQGIAAMQQINRTIINPLFMLAFMGTGVVALILGVRAARHLDTGYGRWLLAATLLYVLLVWIVTFAFNVPRNNSLDTIDPNAATSVGVWNDYVREWTRWNHVRTIGAIASLIAFVQAWRLA